MRVIEGLKWAKPCERPQFIRASRPKGLKALGLRFERSVGKALQKHYQEVKSGQWWQYADVNGLGWCQTDHLINLSGAVIAVECKLTEAEEGREQLLRLYFPILKHVFEREVVGVVVLRHLTRETRRELIADGLVSAIRRANSVPMTVQWLGKGRI